LVIPLARTAIGLHGEHPDLLCNITTVKLYQRQPALALRSALLQQLWASLRPIPINLSNQLNSYEMNGHVDWLEWLLPQLVNDPLTDQHLQGNLTMQLASAESKLYRLHLERFVQAVEPTSDFARCRDAGLGLPRPLPTADKSLRIAWITGDLCPHPVSRFLLGFFEASRGLRMHSHSVVSVFDHGTETSAPLFAMLPGIDLIDVSGLLDASRVAAVRELQCDLAIDLSGWTGGNYIAGFMARLAPVQVNYLGYFASAGIPQMDYWLGDGELFPSEFSDWHSEILWRLPRPFLAWQPSAQLPEAALQVVEATPGPMRFGSFNHNRKLSDRTLRLWGQVLQACPGSQLVLKANAQSDPSTQELLRRRMLRCGLDPVRVQWLPLAATTTEHLEQYRHIDIALDPIPNGGCTTTCEALWMGAPVITLEGSTYVSRMSTAVLRGAGLGDWVCGSEADYVRLAAAQACNLAQLRRNRDQWRRQVVASPLGDAADLMRHLEQAFSAMHARALTAC